MAAAFSRELAQWVYLQTCLSVVSGEDMKSEDLSVCRMLTVMLDTHFSFKYCSKYCFCYKDIPQILRRFWLLRA